MYLVGNTPNANEVKSPEKIAVKKHLLRKPEIKGSQRTRSIAEESKN
jgi:hypothetical protein